MANVYLTGFDDHDAGDLAYEWTVTGSPTIVTALTGSAVRFSEGKKIVRAVPSAQIYTIGFRFQFSSLLGQAVIFGVGDSTKTSLMLTVNADGTMSAYLGGGYGSTSLSLGASTLLDQGSASIGVGTATYVEVEIKVANSGGYIRTYLNGSDTPDASFSGDTCNNTETMSWFALGLEAASIGNLDVDDVYCNDTTGTDCTGLMGDVQVDFHLPVTPDGTHHDWEPSTGSDNFAMVDDNPIDTADYNTGDAANEIDTFNCEDFKNGDATIYALQIGLIAQKTETGTAELVDVIRESGSDTPGSTEAALSTSWTSHQFNYSLAEADGKRAAAGFNAAEFGYKRTA